MLYSSADGHHHPLKGREMATTTTTLQREGRWPPPLSKGVVVAICTTIQHYIILFYTLYNTLYILYTIYYVIYTIYSNILLNY